MHGWLWHGHQVEGLDRIPSEGAALIIQYHGALMPPDYFYLITKVFTNKGRLIRLVADRFLISFPGLSYFTRVFRLTAGSVQSCVEDLQNGNILAIAPGGLRESLFSNENYPIVWNKRLGFARVAHQARVPIIPVFTRNQRETIRASQYGKSLFRILYEWSRMPIWWIYGGFPVKLVTFIGEPIHFDADKVTVEEVAEMVWFLHLLEKELTYFHIADRTSFGQNDC